MKLKLIASAFLGAVAVSGAIVTSARGQEGSERIFSCDTSSDDYSQTFLRNINGSSYPIIKWERNDLWAPFDVSDRTYSHKERCQSVSNRLNAVMTNLGYPDNLENINFATGDIVLRRLEADGRPGLDRNGNPDYIDPTVICVVSAKEPACTKENMLFTLNPNNAERSNEILTNFVNLLRNPDSSRLIIE